MGLMSTLTVFFNTVGPLHLLISDARVVGRFRLSASVQCTTFGYSNNHCQDIRHRLSGLPFSSIRLLNSVSHEIVIYTRTAILAPCTRVRTDPFGARFYLQSRRLASKYLVRSLFVVFE